MINTSAKWKEWSAEHGTFHIKAELDNGTKLNLTDEDFMLGSVSITDSVSGMGAFNVGGVITNSFNATLNNFTGKFNSYNLAGATIDVKFGVVTDLYPPKTLEGYIGELDGQFYSASSRVCFADYFEVEPSATYDIYYNTDYSFSLIYYDEDKTFISGTIMGGNTSPMSWTAPNNVHYVRISFASGYGGEYNDDFKIVDSNGNTITVFSEWIDRGIYTLEKPTSLGSTIKVTGYDYMDRLNQRYDGSYDVLSNLIDISDVTQNKSLETDGTVIDKVGYFITDYISVTPSSTYKCNLTTGFVCTYDSSKNYVGYVSLDSNGEITTNSGIYYIRGASLSALRTQAYVKGSPNLVDTSAVTATTKVNKNSGVASYDPLYFTTDYMPVEDGKAYYSNLSADYLCCYDSSKNFLGSVDYTDTVKPGTPAWRLYYPTISGQTVAYVRGSGLTTDLNISFLQYRPDMTPSFPIDASQMVENICSSYGIGFDANSWGLDSFNVNEFEYNENTSVRQVLSWIMEIGGGYARINPTGTMECKAFNRHEWTSDSTLNGGTINPWESVSAISGGTFSPWSSVTDYDGGSTGGAEFTLSKIKSLDVYIEDIEITGVRAFYIVDNEEQSVLDGANGYVIGISNPMVNADNASAIATRVGTALNGLSFRPFDASIFGDPSFEAGDVVALKDYLGVEHISIITSLTYNLNTAERIECNAETTMNQNNNYSSNSSTIIQEASNYIKGEMADYVISEGTSGNWTYRIWSSGIKECWYKGTDNVNVSSAWGSGYSSSIKTVADYPVTFANKPTVVFNVKSANGSGIATYAYDDTVSNSGSYYVVSFASGSYSIEVNIYAKGV